jgi:hypothetical protein
MQAISLAVPPMGGGIFPTWLYFLILTKLLISRLGVYWGFIVAGLALVGESIGRAGMWVSGDRKMSSGSGE